MNLHTIYTINKLLTFLCVPFSFNKKYRRKILSHLNKINIGYYIKNIEKKTYAQYMLKDGYNLALRDGNGDTLLTLAALPEFERIYKGKVKVFIKPSHEYLMKMFNLTNYFVVNAFKDKLLYMMPINKKDYPTKGDIWFVNHRYNKNVKTGVEHFANFKEEILSLLNLPLTTELVFPEFKPQISKEFLNKLQKYCSVDKIVLLIPEANSKVVGNLTYWEDLASLLKKEGYCVFANIMCSKNKIKNADLNEDFSMEDLISLGFSCKAIVSIRNGLCDILHKRGKALFVFDTSQSLPKSKKYFNLNDLYGRNDINEYFDEKHISSADIVKQILSL